MAHPKKIAEVKLITEKLQAAQSLVMADFTGLSVLQMTDFRAKCRAQKVECRVVKNRLAKIAADAADLAVVKDKLTGPTAFIFGPESQVDPAKMVIEFAKEHKALTVKGGIVDGEFIDAEQVVALAKIPGWDELIAQMMGSINSPIRGLAVTIGGVAAALARVIDAVAKQKAEAETAA